jgi:4-cresol dehydrogenase (hydroxylating) flavoprotein subunit
MDSSAFAEALRSWERLLGPDHVRCDSQALGAASTATFATSARVLAILQPGSRHDVQEIVRIANTYLVPIHPISSGKNWGYGSRVPPRDGVLVDLGRMNRILDFSEDLAYVTVEPGVTQRQLFDFLRLRNSGLWMDATGASPDCSIIGNTMERGFGHTPMADHCSNACGLEVVLASGEVVNTGFSRFPGARVGALSRWGVGPSLDGLFSQSRLGIVTRMSVWLMPAPEHFEAFFFTCRAHDDLRPVIDALRPLRMNGTLRSVMHIGNDYKVLAASSQYPWAQMQGRTPLDRRQMELIRARLGIGCWNGSGGLYGTRTQVREARRLLRRALRGKVQRLQFVNDRLLRLMGAFAAPARFATGWDIEQLLKILVPVYNLLKGAPTDSTLASAYWRKKTTPPAIMDPDKDGCGLLWSSPVLPNSGTEVTSLTKVVGELLLAHGFEPQFSISLATERTLICVITISYDRSEPGEDDRAMVCYRALNEQLMNMGYPPYRWSVVSGHDVHESTGFDRTLRMLTAALDPNDILSPGRYEPGAAPAEPSPAMVSARLTDKS